MSNIVLKFPVYEMETENFMVSIWSGIIPEYGLHYGNRKNFWFTKWKLEILWFPFDLELSRNSGLRNKFPDHSISKMEIFSGKMETLPIYTPFIFPLQSL